MFIVLNKYIKIRKLMEKQFCTLSEIGEQSLFGDSMEGAIPPVEANNSSTYQLMAVGPLLVNTHVPRFRPPTLAGNLFKLTKRLGLDNLVHGPLDI